MNIIFFGTSEFAIPSLEALLEAEAGAARVTARLLVVGPQLVGGLVVCRAVRVPDGMAEIVAWVHAVGWDVFEAALLQDCLYLPVRGADEFAGMF